MTKHKAGMKRGGRLAASGKWVSARPRVATGTGATRAAHGADPKPPMAASRRSNDELSELGYPVMHGVGGAPEAVFVPIAEFRALKARLEALEADFATALERAVEAAREGERIPLAMWERLATGESPVKVWRRHRGMKARELAAAAGLSTSALSEIETGKSGGSFRVMARIAEALGTDLDELVSPKAAGTAD